MEVLIIFARGQKGEPTDDLISKRSAHERLIIAKTLLETVLQDMPAEPRTGKWVLMSDCTGKYYACSWCGHDGYSGMHYCPNCGEKMEEKHERTDEAPRD